MDITIPVGHRSCTPVALQAKSFEIRGSVIASTSIPKEDFSAIVFKKYESLLFGVKLMNYTEML